MEAYREIEKKLKNQIDLFSTLVENVSDYVYLKDFGGNYITDNLAHRILVGASSANGVSGKNTHDFFPPKIADYFVNDDNQVLKTGNAILDQEEIVVDASGNEHLISTRKLPMYGTDGTVIGILGIGKNITEKNKIMEERDLLRLLIDNIPHHIYLKDKESKFIIANSTTASVMGVEKPALLINKRDIDLHHPPELANKYFQEEQKIIATGEPLISYQERFVDFAGHNRWLLTTKVPFFNTNGEIAGIVGINHDITNILEKTTSLVTLFENIKVSINSSEDPKSILEAAVETLYKQTLGVDWVTIVLSDDEEKMYLMVSYPHQETYGLNIVRPNGYSHQILKSGTPVIISNTDENSHVNPVSRLQGYKAVLGLPMFGHSRRIIGVTWFHYKETHEFTGNEQNSLQSYVNEVALAYANALQISMLSDLQGAIEEAISATKFGDIFVTARSIVEGSQVLSRCDAVTLYLNDITSGKLLATPVSKGLKFPRRTTTLDLVADQSDLFTF